MTMLFDVSGCCAEHTDKILERELLKAEPLEVAPLRCSSLSVSGRRVRLGNMLAVLPAVWSKVPGPISRAEIIAAQLR
jgi:hypothetical protein